MLTSPLPLVTIQPPSDSMTLRGLLLVPATALLQFSPCDAMHSATMLSQLIKMSICPSVRLSHAGIVSRRLNISSNIFRRRVATPFQLSMPNIVAIFRRGPPNRGVECRWGMKKIAIFDQYRASTRKRYETATRMGNRTEAFQWYNFQPR